jgi:hypothetical protein
MSSTQPITNSFTQEAELRLRYDCGNPSFLHRRGRLWVFSTMNGTTKHGVVFSAHDVWEVNMTKSIGWLAIGGIFSFVAASEAQTQALLTATTAFDGSYAFVSATLVQPVVHPQCTDSYNIGGPLVAAQGRAEFTNLLGHHSHFEGTIGSQGELMMRASAISPQEINDIFVNGRIDRDGTVRARMTGRLCSYDVVWQKEHK